MKGILCAKTTARGSTNVELDSLENLAGYSLKEIFLLSEKFDVSQAGDNRSLVFENDSRETIYLWIPDYGTLMKQYLKSGNKNQGVDSLIESVDAFLAEQGQTLGYHSPLK